MTDARAKTLSLLLVCLAGLAGGCGDKDEDEGKDRGEPTPLVTPLVLRFDQLPVEVRPTVAEQSFLIEQDVTCGHDWPTASNPWLVRDLNHDGQVNDGAELFGSGTQLRSGELARHGFEALAELDHNQDGVLDGDDPGFDELQLWWDHDRDRGTDRRELSPLSAMGIQAISLDYRVQPECDHRGNCGRERAPMVFGPGGHDSNVGEVVDLYLACQEPG